MKKSVIITLWTLTLLYTAPPTTCVTSPFYERTAFGTEVYSWDDLRSSTTSTEHPAMTKDEDAVTFRLPFPFPVYGEYVGVVTLGSNGVLGFDRFSPASTPPKPKALPAYRLQGPVLAAYWADLDPSIPGVGAQVHTEVRDNNQVFVMQLSDFPQHGASEVEDESLTLQIHLHASGPIHIMYHTTPSAKGGDYTEVRKHVIGMQYHEDDDGITVRASRMPMQAQVGLILSPLYPPERPVDDVDDSIFAMADPSGFLHVAKRWLRRNTAKARNPFRNGDNMFPYESNLFALNERYVFLERVHLEEMLVVYKARDRQTGDLVAIKIAELDHDPDERPPMGDDVPRDVRTMALVQGHPYINVLLDWVPFTPTGTYALIMDFISTSENVTDLELPQIARYMADTLTALHHVHSKGLLYRDLKRDNLFYNASSGRVTLMDFDCTAFHDPAVGHTSLTGTDGHLAPEMFIINAAEEAARENGTTSDMVGYSFPVDVYAAGIVFGELLFHAEDKGEIPWETYYAWMDDLPPAPQYDLLRRMLDPMPESRITVDQALGHPFFPAHGVDLLTEISAIEARLPPVPSIQDLRGSDFHPPYAYPKRRNHADHHDDL